MNLNLLEEITQAWGVSGREKKVREIIKREVQPYADEMTTDRLGNLIVFRRGIPSHNSKTIMLSAHMDEVGFQATKIETDGRIRLCKVGWVWASSIYNDKIISENGVMGVVGCVGSVEEARNDITRLYVDIGCVSKEETEEFVKVGDYFGFVGKYYDLCHDRITAKSLDDRAGCFALIEAVKRNRGASPNDIYYVFSVQEELGCRGGLVAAERIRPDVGISVDVTPDHAYPCDLEGSNAVGAGVGVKFGDPSAVLDEYLVNEMVACCEENGIPFQRDVMDRGGTDASSMNLAYHGAKVAGISLVCRYPHSQSAVISKYDLESAIELIEKYTARVFLFGD